MVRAIALVPAFNESQRIGATVRALAKIDGLDEVIVVDDGSVDDTRIRAEEAGAEVIQLKRNAGKGKALNYALERIDRFDILLLVDADLGESAKEAKTLMLTVLEGKADMAVAGFPKLKKKSGFGLVKKLGRWGIRKCAGIEVDEPLSGQRAINRRVLESVGELEKGFGVEVALTIDAARLGHKVVEISLPMSHAATGRNISGFLHRGYQFFDVFRVIFRRLIQG